MCGHADIDGKDSMVGRIRRINLGVNCYLIDVECGHVLIDTGFPATIYAGTNGAGICLLYTSPSPRD